MAKIEYLSPSAIIAYLSNPFVFYKEYIIRQRDNKDSIATLIGKGMHKLIENKLLNKNISLDELNLNLVKNIDMKEFTLSDLDRVFDKIEKLDSYINKDNTVLSSIFNVIYKSKQFQIEKEFITEIKTKNNNVTKIKGFIDCFYIDDDGVTIIDWKSVTSFSSEPKINYLLQGLLYSLPFIKDKMKINQILFVEIKKSANRDGSDICNVVKIDPNSDDSKEMFGFIYTIIDTILNDVENKKLWLPNPTDLYDKQPLETLRQCIKLFDDNKI